MQIKINPYWSNRTEPTGTEQDQFKELLELLYRNGWSRLLLHYTDGSVLLKRQEQDKPE